MKVLLVDDEQRVLDGLVRSLFHLADEWCIKTADSGEGALALLATEAFDVIITDMRMPGMDGVALLSKVCERHPHTVRIVLSGHADAEGSLRAAHLAHQFLAKPCDSAVLQQVVERALSLRTVLKSAELQKMVTAVKRLPSPPATYNALTRALSDPTSGIADIASIMQRDPAMSAKVLQLVNSAFFANAQPLGDVRQAVARLGVRMIRSLALAVEVFATKHGASSLELSTVERVRTHGLRVGSVARLLFTEQRLIDEAFMAGLLVDIGALVLAGNHAAKLTEANTHARQSALRLYESEEQLWGVSHAEIGAYLLSLWGLPPRIVEAVAFHHRPESLAIQQLDLVAAIHVANELVEQREPQTKYLVAIGYTGSLCHLQERATQVCSELGA